MDENFFYDTSSIAAKSKREQYLREAENYNFLHRIMTRQKPPKRIKAPGCIEPLIMDGNLHEKHA